MPDRHTIGAAFLPMAIAAGLTSAIMDARSPQIVRAVKAADLLLDRDAWGAAWIAAHRAQQAGPAGRRRQPQRSAARAPRDDGRRNAAHPARPGQPGLRAGRAAGAGAARRDPVRRGQLERHRHRLDLRRPRHLQEVQGQGRRGPARAVQPGRRAYHAARSCEDGWRLACRAPAAADTAVEVPPLATRPKAATVGVGRQVILRPAVQKRYLELAEPTLADQATDLERVLAALDDLELRADLPVLKTLGRMLREADYKVTAVVVDDVLIAVEPGRHHRPGGSASPSTWAPPRWWPPCSTCPPAPRSRWTRC